MGFGGISIWQLLIVLAIIVLQKKKKKLRGMGGDIGGAVKGFKKAMSDDTASEQEKSEQIQQSEKSTVDGSTNTEKNKDSNKV